MFTSFTRRTRPGASARLRRLIAALTVAAGGMLAWAAAPAASAATIPVPGPAGAYGPVTPGITVRTITVRCPAGRSPSSRSPLPWLRPPPQCSWIAPGPPAGPPLPSGDIQHAEPDISRAWTIAEVQALAAPGRMRWSLPACRPAPEHLDLRPLASKR